MGRGPGSNPNSVSFQWSDLEQGTLLLQTQCLYLLVIDGKVNDGSIISGTGEDKKMQKKLPGHKVYNLGGRIRQVNNMLLWTKVEK